MCDDIDAVIATREAEIERECGPGTIRHLDKWLELWFGYDDERDRMRNLIILYPDTIALLKEGKGWPDIQRYIAAEETIL